MSIAENIKGMLSSKDVRVEVASIGILFVLCFVMFNIIFDSTDNGGFYQNVIAALIGTLITAIITTVLLKKQTTSEEVRERNVEVFKKRVERYEEVTGLLVKVMEDGKIDQKEAVKIKSAIYNLALFASEETLETISDFLRYHIVKDQKSETTFFHIIACFRKDLDISDLRSFDEDDLKPINNLINGNFNQEQIYAEICSYLDKVQDKIVDIFEDADEYQVYEREGVSDGVSLTVKNDKTKLDYIIKVNYPDNNDFSELPIQLYVLSEFKQKYIKSLADKGYEILHDSDSQDQATKEYNLKFNRYEDGDIKITDRSSIKKIISDITSVDLSAAST